MSYGLTRYSDTYPTVLIDIFVLLFLPTVCLVGIFLLIIIIFIIVIAINFRLVFILIIRDLCTELLELFLRETLATCTLISPRAYLIPHPLLLQICKHNEQLVDLRLCGSSCILLLLSLLCGFFDSYLKLL